MNNQFELKNFRVFDEKGGTFEIAPITVLTGCNSSGKSSVIKAMVLLNDFFNSLISDYINGNSFDLKKYELLFNEGKHNLGSYESSLSKYSKEKDFIFSYQTFSELLFSNVEVQFTFALNKKDILKNAVIKEIKIFSENKELLFVKFSEKSEIKINVKEIKSHFFHLIARNKTYNQFTDSLKHSDWDVIKNFKNFKEYKKRTNCFETNENIINIKNNIINRDDINKLFLKIDDINSKHKSLFYNPILDLLGNSTKENISENYSQIVRKWKDKKNNKKKIDSTNFDKLDKELKRIFNDFSKSNSNSFIEYFLDLEDEYLSNKSNKLLNINTSTLKHQSFTQIINNHFVTFVNNKFISLDENYFFNQYGGTHGNNMPTSSNLFVYYDYYINNGQTKFETIFFNLAILSSYIDSQYRKNRFLLLYNPFENFDYPYIELKELNLAKLFFNTFLQECFLKPPTFLSNMNFIEASRTNLQRIYSFKNRGTSFNDLIKRYLVNVKDNSDSQNANNSYKVGDFIKKWLTKFEIADDIQFKLTEDGQHIYIYLVKGDEKTFLADEGYGITQLLPILLQIELKISQATVTTSHPFVSEKIVKYSESSLAIEEPETNLHPKFQSLLAEMFMDAYKTYNIRFIVETHSEYLIRKLQTLIAKGELTPDNVSLNYIYEYDKTKRPPGKPQVMKIKINNDGRLNKPFGSGFFDEADNLAMDLLTFKTLN